MGKGEKITDKAFVFSLLKRLQNKHALLTATVRGSAQPCNTTILEIGADNPPYIILDELNNTDSHKLYLERGTMVIKGRLEGLSVSFECELLHTNNDEEVAKYYVAFPNYVIYHQKRESYRIHISPDLQFPVNIIYESKQKLSGLVVDISQTGIGIIFDEFIKFEPGNFINECKLILPRHDKLNCKVTIRHTCYHETTNTTHLGVQMLNLLNKERREYLKAVAHIQRQMVRRHARVQHQ